MRTLLLWFALGSVIHAADAPAALSPLTPEKARELFDALDLTTDALKPVAVAVAANDFPKAEHELAEYLRHRPDPIWKFSDAPNPAVKDEVAENAVIGRVQGGLVRVWHTFPDNKIDWTYNPTLVTPGMTKNYQWQWQLARMSFWTNLGNAYRATKDEKYTKAWLAQFHSYDAQQFPPPTFMDNGRPGSTWATLNVGIRMNSSWPTAFFSFLPSPEFSDADIALFLVDYLETAHYLMTFHGPGNGLMMEMAGVYTAGAYFPEFKEATSWRQYAVNRMLHEETAQFLPDGVEDELSTMYHNVAIDNFVIIARVARNTGRQNELPPGYISGLEKAYDFDLYMMTPDRFFPAFNDSLSYHLAGVFKTALEFFPDRADYQWAASDGAQGQPPPETSHTFPWAGYYVMRSGWDKAANYAVFRAGPLGIAHAHQDKLTVVLWAFGRQLLFNSGGAGYEISKWRGYSIDTFSKNTVLVDNKPQYRDPKNNDLNASKAPIEARWESTADHDFAAGIYDEGYGSLLSRPAIHQRRVLFVKPDLFIVADTLTPRDGAVHTYQARWNLMTTQTNLDPTTHVVTTLDAGQPNLALVPLQTGGLEVRAVSAQTEPEILGWNIRKDLTPEQSPATTVLHTWKGAGVESFLTLLAPIPTGATSPIKGVKEQASGVATVYFNDGRSLFIQADSHPAGGIEVTETLANGQPGRHVKTASARVTASASSR